MSKSKKAEYRRLPVLRFLYAGRLPGCALSALLGFLSCFGNFLFGKREVKLPDEVIVDVHLLGLDTIWPDYLFMYHYFLNQFVEDVGRQLCNAGIFPDEGQELFDIFVDLIALCNLCCQLLPLPLEGGDILKGCCAPAGACGREQPVNAGCRERFLRCGRRQSRQMPTANHLEKTRR